MASPGAPWPNKEPRPRISDAEDRFALAYALLEFTITTPPSTWVLPRKTNAPGRASRPRVPRAVGELHELRDVLPMRPGRHGDWLLVHDVSPSSADELQDGIIEVQYSP